MHSFETALSVGAENFEGECGGFDHIAWAEFLLNPRRLLSLIHI